MLLLDCLVLGLYVLLGAADILLDAGEMHDFWNIAEEGSASELVNYLKWIFICVSLFVVYGRCKAPLFACFSFVFALILMDDSLQVHERGGDWLVTKLTLQPAFGLRAQDFGELSVWAILGGLTGLVLLYGYSKRTSQALPFGYYFIAVLIALVFFAMGFDMLNAWDGLNEETTFNNIITGLLTLIEDGGEMFVASFGVAGAVAALTASKTNQWPSSAR